MRRPSRGAILVGLLGVSLGSYWAADAGSTAVQVVVLGIIGGLSLLAVWAPK